MRLLISDANILIDMESGELMDKLFALPMQFGIPDLLYYEEIEPCQRNQERIMQSRTPMVAGTLKKAVLPVAADTTIVSKTQWMLDAR